MLVPEPGTGLDGRLKTARKGIGSYRLAVKGVASHSGVDFAAGASAILELGRQLERVAALTDLKRGTTLNPGVIRGGSRVNVVAAEAEAEIDLRVVRLRDADGRPEAQSAEAGGPALRADPEWRINRPPMERTAGVVQLFRPRRRWRSGIWGWRLRNRPRGADRTAISPPRWACRRWMALARWAKARTLHTRASWWTGSRIGRRCWPC